MTVLDRYEPRTNLAQAINKLIYQDEAYRLGKVGNPVTDGKIRASWSRYLLEHGYLGMLEVKEDAGNFIVDASDEAWALIRMYSLDYRQAHEPNDDKRRKLTTEIIRQLKGITL